MIRRHDERVIYVRKKFIPVKWGCSTNIKLVFKVGIIRHLQNMVSMESTQMPNVLVRPLVVIHHFGTDI